MKDGLSQNSVFAITQDKDGLMWLGTRNGLNKFDGYSMTVYRHTADSTSIVSSDVRVLYPDPLNRYLWIGTSQGLSRFNPTDEAFRNYKDEGGEANGFTGNIVRCIYRDRQDRLWVGTSVGLNLYDPAADQFQLVLIGKRTNDSLLHQEIKALYEDTSLGLLVGTNRGLFALKETDRGRYTLNPLDMPGLAGSLLEEAHIKTINIDQEQNLWVGTHANGIFLWKRTTRELINYREDRVAPYQLSHNNIRSVTVGPEGQVWVGTFSGLNQYDPSSKSFRQLSMGDVIGDHLSSNSIRSVFLDSRGSLWVGTYYGGVNYFHKDMQRFKSYQSDRAAYHLNSNVISCFEEDPNGNFWIGTGDGIHYFDYHRDRIELFTFGKAPNSLKDETNVKCLLLEDRQLWIGTFREGLFLWDLETGEWKRFHQETRDAQALSSNDVYSLLRYKDQLWVATYGGGLNIYDRSTQTVKAYQQEHTALRSDECRVLFKAKTGDIWLGTEDGLYRVRVQSAKEKEGLTFEPFLPGFKIYALHETRDGKLWVGTYFNGLICLGQDGKIEKSYTTDDGLAGNSVIGILEDTSGNLWLSTNNGLSKLDGTTETFTSFGHSNGLSSLEFNFNAYQRARSGMLLFGAINGFIVFNPDSIRPSRFEAPLVFTELEVQHERVLPKPEGSFLQKSLNETEMVVFPYNKANFSIGFAALDYFNPAYNQYLYKLEGIDSDWIPAMGVTRANYTLQRPGTYTFRIRGTNSDGVWSQQERTLAIKVLPPLWRSNWAFVLYILLLGVIIYTIYYLMQLRYQLQLEHIEKLQQNELYKAKIRFFTNITHELRTPLTLIITPLEDLLNRGGLEEKLTHQLVSVTLNAKRLLNLVNEILNFRKMDTVKGQLQLSQNDIVPFLQEIFDSFKEVARIRNIDYNFFHPDTRIKIAYEPGKLDKVFFNLLSNAFKFTPDGGRIDLILDLKPPSLYIEVVDNGAGIAKTSQRQIFKRFFSQSTDIRSLDNGTGIGLELSRQMVELHGGSIAVESESGKGTRFLVKLPMDQAGVSSVERPAKINAEPAGLKITPLENGALAKSSILENLKPLNNPAGKKIRILVIEDNQELLRYIRVLLEDQYEVLTASDGNIGLELALEAMPDLIVSDIMMPGIDGIEICRQLKTKLETSHIPIILLTAFGDSKKIAGLQTGANDYLTKPFSSEELQLRIHNLSRLRMEQQQKIVRSLRMEPKEVSEKSPDEQFLEQCMQIIESHIDNPSFDVEQFAHELAISRPLLFNKIKALTGLTPNNFIKSVRLRRAAQLLRKDQFTVAEIAYRVGFRNPRYFSKCFQQQFDKTPTEFVQDSIRN